MTKMHFLCNLLLVIALVEGHPKPKEIIPAFWPDPGQIKVKDLFDTVKNVTTVSLNKIPDAVPSPNDLLRGSKQLILGYPLEAASTVLNDICSVILSNNAVVPVIKPDDDRMKLIFMTGQNNYSYHLLDADKLWQNPEFNTSKKTVIFVTGWRTDLNETNEAIDVMSQAYFCRADVNFVVLDSARFVDTLYIWSALNTEDIGEALATALVELIKIVPLESLHLIGHSLGAHIVGAAGRHFNKLTDKEVPRITGLDPAKPCFKEGEELSGLYRGDAQFVDIIHSNPGVLGKRDPMGDADFYPSGVSPLPDGCLTIVCAHERAWRYFAETVYPGNENNFPARRCNSLSSLNTDKCVQKTIPMGFATPKTAHGNFFLEINSDEPFGKNSQTGRNHGNKCIS